MLLKTVSLALLGLTALTHAQTSTIPQTASEETHPLAQHYTLALAKKGNFTFNGMKVQVDADGILLVGKPKSDTQCVESNMPTGKKCSDFSDQLAFYDDNVQSRIAYTNKSGVTQTLFFCSDGILKLSRPYAQAPLCPNQHTSNNAWIWSPKPKEFGRLAQCPGYDGLHNCAQPDGLFTFHSDEMGAMDVPGFYACWGETEAHPDVTQRPWRIYALTPQFNHYEISRGDGSQEFSNHCLKLDGLMVRPYYGPPAWLFYGAQGE